MDDLIEGDLQKDGSDFLVESIGESIINAIGLQPEDSHQLVVNLKEAYDDVLRCEASALAVEEVSHYVRDSLLPEFRKNILELDPLFKVIDIMHKDVLPVVEMDLMQLEQVITTIENNLANACPTTMQSFFNVIKLPMLPSNANSFSTKDCQLHDAESLLCSSIDSFDIL